MNKARDLGWTPLWTGCFFGHTGIVQFLLTQPTIDVNARTIVSWSDGREHVRITIHVVERSQQLRWVVLCSEFGVGVVSVPSV